MWFIAAAAALAIDAAPATSDLQVLPVPIAYPTLPETRRTSGSVAGGPAGFYQTGQQAYLYLDNLPRSWQLQPGRAVGMVSGVQQLGAGTRWMIDGATVNPPLADGYSWYVPGMALPGVRPPPRR